MLVIDKPPPTFITQGSLSWGIQIAEGHYIFPSMLLKFLDAISIEAYSSKAAFSWDSNKMSIILGVFPINPGSSTHKGQLRKQCLALKFQQVFNKQSKPDFQSSRFLKLWDVGYKLKARVSRYFQYSPRTTEQVLGLIRVYDFRFKFQV